MAHLTLSVLGQLQVLIDDIPVSSFESDKVRALLAYLAVGAGRAHQRETLVGLLWPNCPEQDARHNLSQALFNLRLALGDHTARPPYLLITRETIQINRESDYSLDLDQFDGYFSAWEKDRGRESANPSNPFPRLEEMVKLYRGEFLQQFYLEDSAEYEEWILRQRESSHQRVMSALTSLVNEYELRGGFQAARRYALRQLELDPWREEAHSQVMRLLAMEGQRSAAMAQYESCRKVLAAELGVEPSPKTRDLFEQIRSGTFKPKAEPPTPISSPPIHNLPLPLTPFIGREQELADLARLMPDSECRCITLVGPGGIGKTRLALQAAEQQRSEFAQGVAFIPLASVSTLDAVIPAMATGIGLAFYGPTDPKVQLLNYLRDKQMLLVVDSVEHLLVEGPQQGTIADLLIEILQAASQAKLLVTSREAMHLQGEWLFEVQGLAFPGVEQADRLDEYSAVALFVHRARRARPGFELNAEDKRGVVRICRLVEGLPLAIELAAAWVRILSPAEIAKEIETNLDFLNARMRDLPERHRSMRAVFEHSWALLSVQEQTVLRKLSVFRGGFTRAAAADVAGATLELVSALVAKSLVRRGAGGRYDLHELVRQEARDRLRQAGAEPAARQAHAAWAVAFAQDAQAHLYTQTAVAWLDAIELEHHNVRAALQWALEPATGEAATQRLTAGLSLLVTLTDFFFLRGHHHEALAYFEQFLARPEAADCPRVRLPALTQASYFYYLQGRLAEAQAVLDEAFALNRTLGDREQMARGLEYHGLVASAAGDLTTARDSLQKSLHLWHELQAGFQHAEVLGHLGDIALAHEDYTLAERLYAQAIEPGGDLAHVVRHPYPPRRLAYLALRHGDCARAADLAGQSLRLNLAIHDARAVAACLVALASVAQAQNQPVRAARLCGAAEAILHSMGASLLPADQAEYDRTVAVLRAGVNTEGLDAAWAEGRSLSLAQAADEALRTV